MFDPDMTAAEIISMLGLTPHPEGGHYRETFRDSETDAVGRARSTAIYYLLEAGELSAWPRKNVKICAHMAERGRMRNKLSADEGR